MLEQRQRTHHPESLARYQADQEQAFHTMLQECKVFYSQPTLPQSTERIKNTADAVISEKPLIVQRGDETITYDARGRAEVIRDGNLSTSRKYDDSGYITEEEITEIGEDGNKVSEYNRFTYGFQNGNLAVQEIYVAPFIISQDGLKNPIKNPFTIDLRGYAPTLPLKQSKPSFTSSGDK